jgi:hypothetical protein
VCASWRKDGSRPRVSEACFARDGPRRKRAAWRRAAGSGALRKWVRRSHCGAPKVTRLILTLVFLLALR